MSLLRGVSLSISRAFQESPLTLTTESPDLHFQPVTHGSDSFLISDDGHDELAAMQWS